MKICQYAPGRAGVVEQDRIYPIDDALVKAGHVRDGHTMLEVIDALANRPGAMNVARESLKSRSSVALASAKLLAPITNPPSIWAAAMNYRDHQAEMRERVKSADHSSLAGDDLMAEFFLKPVSSIIGPGGPVVLPRVSKHVDFECELCAVIGKTARRVTEERALDYVFGYTMCWDFSQRNPWGIGRQNTRNIRKGFDTFTGLGPWIVTKDEVPDPQNLSFRVEQNGKQVMNAHTSNMICSLREHIRFLSGVLTLSPATLITTGTPAGVSQLADGDHLKGAMEGIGEIEFDVRAER